MITSHEYILDYRILPNQELDESSIHTKYTIVDTVNMDKYEVIIHRPTGGGQSFANIANMMKGQMGVCG